MKLTFTTQNFKGYDATSIKNLYLGTLEKRCDLDIVEDLNNVCKREGIKLYSTTADNIFEGAVPDIWVGGYMNIWNQDKMLFIKGKNGVEVLSTDGASSLPTRLSKRFKEMGIAESETRLKTEGGNFFIGEKENGEKYILAGKSSEEDVKKIAQIQNIKAENIHIIPQTAFHIDMIVRPIGYPYILVNDEEEALENIEKLNIPTREKQNLKRYAEKTREDIARGRRQIYGKEIAKMLEAQGFKPILIGGIYSFGANFMNAIVHKRNDGKLVYITNSAENTTKEQEKLQKIFENDLRKKVPNIAKVDFILGKEARVFGENNMQNFLIADGGVHCLCAEEPNFNY
ncbi:MAG: hypothetical protein E7Z91_06955 [Cyanobacteria bacterium SIG30]|nr:hypothetical protein [Cyanobacteria bacterium SIG30]